MGQCLGSLANTQPNTAALPDPDLKTDVSPPRPPGEGRP